MPPRPSAREFQPPERRPWSEIGPEFARIWGRPRGKVQPEHVAIYGPTGSGKSWWEATILVERVRLRQSGVIVVATKPDDATLTDMGWPITDSWLGVRQNDQVIFWPRTSRLGRARKAYQAEKIQDLLDRLWVPQSNNIVAFEDASYIEGLSGDLRDTLEMYLREGRSNGITVIRNKQRVQGGTRLMHSETDWKIAFAPSDEDDAERNAQLFGNKRDWTPVLQELDREQREFVIQHKLTGVTYISWVDESPLDRPQKAALFAGRVQRCTIRLYGPNRYAEQVGPFSVCRRPLHLAAGGNPRVKHTHFSVIAASQAFLAVVIVGTLWRLVALHLMASGNPTANQIGEGMSFQY